MYRSYKTGFDMRAFNELKMFETMMGWPISLLLIIIIQKKPHHITLLIPSSSSSSSSCSLVNAEKERNKVEEQHFFNRENLYFIMQISVLHQLII